MPNPNLPINFRKNTYIGARYVPKFADTPGSEWDNSIQYEPLTIVLYQGNSYTSKTFVPTGIDITNKTYWAQTGNYNAQMQNLINVFNNINDELRGKLDKLTQMLVFPKTIQDTQPEGNCGALIYNNGHGILFDIGDATNHEQITQSLLSHGLKKIDAMIISHWHGDHMSNMDWSDFDTSQCIMYLPLTTSKWPQTQTWLAEFNTAFPNNRKIFPNEGSSYQIHNYTLQFYNCGSTSIAYWDALSAKYNEYSMVTFISVGNNKLMFPGDIETLAQEKLYNENKFYQSIFVAAPHHGVDSDGSVNLGLSVAPKIIYMADQVGGASKNWGSKFIGGAIQRGCDIYSNAENDEDVIFQLTDDGQITSPNSTIKFSPSFLDIEYHVNPNSTAPHANGSVKCPFKDITQAIAFCNLPMPYKIIVDVAYADNIVFKGKSNIEFQLPEGFDIKTLVIHKARNIKISGGAASGVCIFENCELFVENTTLKSVEIRNSIFRCLNIKLIAGTNQFLYALNSTLNINSITYEGTTNVAYSLNNSIASFHQAIAQVQGNVTAIFKLINSNINLINVPGSSAEKFTTNDSNACMMINTTTNKIYVSYAGNNYEVASIT